MAIIMFINLKGGVAKTTNTVAVAECLAAKGYKTLVVDADHQCMASELLLGADRLLRCENRKETLHDLMAGMLGNKIAYDSIEQYAESGVSNIDGGIPNLAMIPCSIRIEDFQSNRAKARQGFKTVNEFLNMLDRGKRLLRRWMESEFDYTIIDCPPSIAIQVRYLLSVADAYVIPSVPDRLSVRGSLWLLDRLHKLGYRKPGLGTLWSLYRAQNAMHKEIIAEVQKSRGEYRELPKPFETVIPNAAAIAQSTDPNAEPHSFNEKYTYKFAHLYDALCEELIERSVAWAETKR